jgi:hypothetical protein
VKRLLAALLLVASPALAQSNGWREIQNGWGEIQTPPSALPATAGNDGKVLTVSTGGTATEWAAAPAPGAAGSDTQVNFNDGGVLAGNAGFTFAKASKALGLTGPLTLTPGADIVPATFRAFSSGTNHIQQNQDSSNNILSGWTHAGEPFLLAGKGAGKVLTSDANGVGTWAAAGLGITNSAGANVLTKSDGTNLVASSLSDSGTAVTSTVPVLHPAGTAAAPSIALAADKGFFSVSTLIGWSGGGTAGGNLGAAGVYLGTGKALILNNNGDAQITATGAAATLQLGAAAANADGVDQTLQTQGGITGTDRAAGDLTIQTGVGTGTGASKIVFRTPTRVGTGTTAQTNAARMTISDIGVNLQGLPVFADNTAAAALATGDLYQTSTGVLMIKY